MGKKKKKVNSVNNEKNTVQKNTIPSEDKVEIVKDKEDLESNSSKIEKKVTKKTNISLKEPIEETKIENEKDQIEEIELKQEEIKEDEINNEEEKNIDLEKEEAFEQVKETKKSRKALFVVSFCFVAIVFLLLIFSTVFALITSHQNTIIKGVKIKDIDISGLTKEEALQKVSSTFNKKLEKQIILQHNDYELAIFLGQFDVSFNLEESINMAYNKGRMRKYFSK